LGALTLRIEHYLSEVYNRRSHQGIGGLTPEERFLADKLPLSPLDDIEDTCRRFVITKRRKVSKDHIVMVGRVPYEVPRGYAGKLIDVTFHTLDLTVWILHEGRLVQIQRVDPVLNATTRRARSLACEPARASPRPMPTAATMAFERAHQPIVGDAGDFFDEE
jgi:hypothetical protein